MRSLMQMRIIRNLLSAFTRGVNGVTRSGHLGLLPLHARAPSERGRPLHRRLWRGKRRLHRGPRTPRTRTRDMAKKIAGYIKLQIPAGKANPSPPVGPALGQRGLNIMQFCKAFNAQTQKMEPGLMLPVVIIAYADKSFTFILKSPPASVLIRKALKLEKGSSKPNADK